MTQVSSPKIEDSGSFRSIDRGLSILRAVNQLGSATLTDVCNRTDLSTSTAHRILRSLVQMGYLSVSGQGKKYVPTILTTTLSSGYYDHEEFIAAARPHLEEFTKQFLWPVIIMTKVGPNMVVRESTTHRTTLTFSLYERGYVLPMLTSASGMAYLAFCSDNERANIRRGLALLDGVGFGSLPPFPVAESAFERIRKQGHATMARCDFTKEPGKTSSIAVPLFYRDKLVGTLTTSFFSNAMSMSQAEADLVPHLKATADRIASSGLDECAQSAGSVKAG